MNRVQDLLQKIEKAGVFIQLKDDDTLTIKAPKGTLTNEQKSELAQNKRDIIHILKNKPAARCQGCPYHDIGPDSFGKDVVHWCGPWSESDGERWLNIAELTACPLGRWGEAASRAVH